MTTNNKTEAQEANRKYPRSVGPVSFVQPGGEAVAEIEMARDRRGPHFTHCDVRLRVYNGYTPKAGDKLYIAPSSVEALQKEVERLTRQVQEYKGYYDGCESQLVAAVEERLQLRAQLTAAEQKLAELTEQLEFTKQQVIGEMENAEHFKQLAQPAGNVGDQWHAPGFGEIHNKDHSRMLFCEKDQDGEMIADDELASTVCALLSTPAVTAGSGKSNLHIAEHYAAALHRMSYKVEQPQQGLLREASDLIGEMKAEIYRLNNCPQPTQAATAVNAEQLAAGQVPEGYKLVKIADLEHTHRQAALAGQLIVDYAQSKIGKMCGYLDDACTAADIAARDLHAMLSAAPVLGTVGREVKS